MQARNSSGKEAHEKAALDEIALALHHYGLSRQFAASGHPSLSSQNYHLARLIIAQNDRDTGSELSSNSKVILSHASDFDKEGSNGLLPQWQQIHNRNCRVCENTLLLGLNCRSVKGGIHCDACGTILLRLEGDREVKRIFRSTSMIREKNQIHLKIDQKKGAYRDESMKKGKQSMTSKQPLEKDSESPDKEARRIMTLEERRAQLKKKKQKQKKRQKEKPVMRKIDWRGSGNTSQDNEEDVSAPTIAGGGGEESAALDVPLPVKVQGVATTKVSKKTGLQRLLADKRLKRDSEEKAKEVQSGLQDFLGSL